jgi:hypothetical protein
VVEIQDVNNDGGKDIIVGGQETDCSGACRYLSYVDRWFFDPAGPSLNRIAHRNWTGVNNESSVQDVEPVDHDGDLIYDIASVGYSRNSTQNTSKLGDLQYMDNQLNPIDEYQWTGSEVDHWGLDSADVDDDGQVELVSVGTKTGVTTVGQQQIVEVPQSGGAAAAAMSVLPALGWVGARRFARKVRPKSSRQ